ncbi:MAG: hypothetical protein ACI8RD_001987 [Bacillariaceae sp.]|jgi:hypothetical protein
MGSDEQDYSVELPSGGDNVEEQMIPVSKSGDMTDGAKKRTRRSERKPGSTTRRRGKKRDDAASQNILIKYGALLLLVAQMVGLVLLMRITRTTNQTEGAELYLASTAVFIMEVMKLGICCCVITYQSDKSLLQELNEHVMQSPIEMMKLTVPSFLYTVQNNLLYFALTNLDAATYQVCYQLKILTTAVFSMILLQVSLFLFPFLFFHFFLFHSKLGTKISEQKLYFQYLFSLLLTTTFHLKYYVWFSENFLPKNGQL